MRCLLLMCIIVGLAAPPVSAQSRIVAHDWPTSLALGSYLTASFVDVAQTAHCLGRGVCRETNPVAEWMIRRTGVVPTLALKGAVNTTLALVILRDRRQHPRRAWWLAVAAASIQTVAVVQNARAIR